MNNYQKQKNRRDIATQNGICKVCFTRPICYERSKVLCTHCLDIKVNVSRRWISKEENKNKVSFNIQRLKNDGKCIQCWTNNSVCRNLCFGCLEKSRLHNKEFQSKPESKLRRKAYVQTHKEKINKQKDGWKQRNLDKIPEIKHKSYIKHKATVVAYSHKQRAFREGVSGSFTKQEWNDLLQAYGNRCLRCGSADKISADHIVPISKGGTNDIYNIQPLCKSCNSIKHTQTINYRFLYDNFYVGT